MISEQPGKMSGLQWKPQRGCIFSANRPLEGMDKRGFDVETDVLWLKGFEATRGEDWTTKELEDVDLWTEEVGDLSWDFEVHL